MCKEFPSRQRRCSWNISQMDRLQELRPSLLLQTWACIPPHPLPWLHFLWREDKGLLASGGLANPLSRQTGRRQSLGKLLFSPLPSGVHLNLGVLSSQPGGMCLEGQLAHSCALSWGAAGAGHCQGGHACSLLTPPPSQCWRPRAGCLEERVWGRGEETQSMQELCRVG